MKGDRERCLAAGMDDYVSKPIHAEDLYAALARWSPAAPQRDEAPMTEMCELDGARALKRAGGDPGLLRELITAFFDDLPRNLAEIDRAMVSRDGPALERSAHRLRSAVGIFTDGPAFQAAGRLELAGHDADFTGAEQTCHALGQELPRLSEAINKVLGNNR
jgi:HPt (histidine-containing phosphotransfer) domain-containing protein